LFLMAVKKAPDVQLKVRRTIMALLSALRKKGASSRDLIGRVWPTFNNRT
jgi:hypothetical protein